jgi:hypothetical protein
MKLAGGEFLDGIGSGGDAGLSGSNLSRNADPHS